MINYRCLSIYHHLSILFLHNNIKRQPVKAQYNQAALVNLDGPSQYLVVSWEWVNNHGKAVKMILKAIMKHVDMWVDIEIIQLQGASSTRTTNYIRGALPSHNHMCLHRWNMESIRKHRFCVTDRNNILTHDTCFGTWNHVNGPTCLKRKVSQLVHAIPWSIPNLGVIPLWSSASSGLPETHCGCGKAPNGCFHYGTLMLNLGILGYPWVPDFQQTHFTLFLYFCWNEMASSRLWYGHVCLTS